MTTLYPEIEPYATGMLDVGDGHLIYWETCGNPHGKPVLVLHGGPGSGCNAGMCRYFDPDACRIILFDQRNCGRSTPHASRMDTDLSTNTTDRLLSDMERLRDLLGVERWMLFGGSWGTTLGLAYAQRHPQRVSAMVLVGITTTRQSEINWLYRDIAPLFPEQWARFCAGAGSQTDSPSADTDMVAAYHRLLNAPDPSVRTQAAQNWCDWEIGLLSAVPDAKPSPRWSDPVFRLAFARIVTHYFHHRAWLEDEVLLRNAGILAGIPGVLIHGRLDLDAPLATAWELARVWRDSQLVIVQGAGHSTTDPGMTEAILAATDRFAHDLP